MAWRILHLSNACRLSLADGQLIVARTDEQTRLPIEDLAAIVLDTPEATFTAALVSACMEAGVAMLFTDQRHHPSGLLLPFHRHHRQADIAHTQREVSLALAAKLWQQIVRAKITAQAAHLALHGANPQPLRAMATRVAPGDPDNTEARAARAYWSALFPNFLRGNGSDLRNAMLDYGYAVMRAAIARALVAAGLLPCFGLHHAGAQNPFNLADDLIEPFRPFVDRLVHQLFATAPDPAAPLTRPHRQALAGVLFEPAVTGPETTTCLDAITRATESLVRVMANGRGRLMLPAFAPAA